ADVSTVEARRSAYDMLLRKGLIRVGLGIPKEAEFELVAVDDPYGFASAAELSLFRRPLPAANLRFLSGVMWDGRETLAGMSIRQDLAHQANGATQGHAQKPDPIDDDQREEIVAFETGLFFAQAHDFGAGLLDRDDALGAPVVHGTCTTCHNAPEVGDHSVALPLDLGLTDASRRTPDLPLYTLRNRATGATIQTTDPGRALITGRWKDVARFKGPILRGLAARP